MFVGIKIHIVYGISGNELPPPVIERNETGVLLDTDDYEYANDLMRGKVLSLRIAARKHCEPYSCSDGYDWKVIKLEDYND